MQVNILTVFPLFMLKTMDLHNTAFIHFLLYFIYILRGSDQNGVSLQEIHHFGQKPSIHTHTHI